MSNVRMAVSLVLLLAAAPAPAQDAAAAADPAAGAELSISELVLGPRELVAGWLELTPLAGDAPASLVRVGDRKPEDGEWRRRPGLPPGAAMLCTGAERLGVWCRQVYLAGEGRFELGPSLDVSVDFAPGLAVRGRYLLGGWGVAGARVAVVPAGLAADRPFTMPLALERSPSSAPAAAREVASDAEGRFALPRLAAGEYFLETVLPSGRVHRGEPFELPVLEDLQRETGAGEDQIPVWDLGEIDVADGLVVEFRVADPQGLPIAGARVAGRQGRTPASLINYEAVTDADGVARLSGFSVEEGVHLSCRQPGYLTFEQDYPLVPVLVSCDLEPLAEVRGEVLGSDGLPPAGGVVSVQALGVSPPAGEAGRQGVEVAPVSVGAAGAFAVGELAAGEYRLQAAAPGYGVEARSFSLEPGQRLELEAIVMLLGRALEGRVIDAGTREPIAGAELRAVSPPGAALEVTGEDGGFTLAARSEEKLVLALTAAGYAGRQVTLTPERLAAREQLTLTLERGGRIRVLVWDEAAGGACQSCRLMIEPPALELVTGGDGEALSQTLAAGWYRVYRPRVSHLGSTVIAQDDAEFRHVKVRPGETSTVRFGERRRSLRVVFRPSPGAGWTLSARTPSRVERYQPDAGGGFLVRHRPGESLDLFLHRYEAEAGAEVEVWQATLPAGVLAAEQVLPLAGAQLGGKATRGGRPMAGERVRLRSLDYALRATARTRPDGSFAIPHLPAGVYAVVIGERNVQFASLRAGQSLDLGSFELTAGGF